jgi:predicted TIM-barrel fold metal-dependent hydrolase
MAEALRSDPSTAPEKVMIVSIDSHVGPPPEVLRPYCSQQYLEDFDEFASEFEASEPSMHGVDPQMFSEAYLTGMMETLARPLMHYDPYERIADMDADGIAAEVLYHGCLNGAPIPFVEGFGVGASMPRDSTTRAAELANEGLRIYNRWLADYCAVLPDRRCGLAQLPFWDPELTVTELHAAHELGLRGINLPAPRPGMPGHHNRIWAPLWEACEELNMPLNSHGGSALVDTEQLIGENSGALLAHEILYWSRRVLWFMVLGGVFDRHPGLKLVLTEQPGGWVMPTLRELDAVAEFTPAFEPVKLAHGLPNDYFRRNCYIGASFMSHADATAAVEQGFADRVMWGSDYPHIEGTFPNSVLSLRLALAGIEDRGAVRMMLGETAADLYGFDSEVLCKVADEVGPSMEELREPVPESDIPKDTASLGFRRGQW